ncbi:conserved hypothetical protein [Hyphomicrobiales bacterium]|jgi:hypothetical protein|nr:conserved hypothetical protein [Hyphomicrobiales bacterium]CAH1702544.1 hypothetical protein BOSEA1005_30416 [Hyphomicrobiales bacterium]CAI0346747.1 conserved hypothetical protein [Hyphomicrobiales bacterium]
MIDEPKIKILQRWDDWNTIAEALAKQAVLERDDRVMLLAASVFRSIGLAATAGCIEEAARQLAIGSSGPDRAPIP